MLGVGTECPPTIFLYSSHRSLFYGILRAGLGSGVSRSGLVNKRMVGGRLLSVALRLSYMNDTHTETSLAAYFWGFGLYYRILRCT